MKIKVNFVIAFLIIISSSLALGQTKKNIQFLLEKEGLSGAVWSIVRNDSIEIDATGFKNIQTKEKLSSKDKVHIGSITKTILALGTLKLATENKLNLDDPIKKYITNLPIKNPWEKTNPVTIRHLLDHTSGLSDLRLWHFFSTSSEPNTPLSEFYLSNPKVLQIHQKPGESFSYSNMGYTILGMLIEKITNQSYENYLDNNLLKQIGMLNSTFHFKSQEGLYKDNDLAMGHFENGMTAKALPIYLRPAAQFTTTAKDMGILIKFIINKGKVLNQQIIKESFFEEYGKPKYTIAFNKGIHTGYALGMSLRDRFNVIGLAHSGNIIGYRAMLYIFPEEKKGFFISHNTDSETANYESFNDILIKTLYIPKRNKKDINSLSTEKFKEWEGYYVPKVTKVLPFKLFDIIGSYSKLEIKDKSLVVTPFQRNSIDLKHVGRGLFQDKDRTKPSHLLYEDGKRKFITTGFSTLEKINGFKILTLTATFILGLISLIIILVIGFKKTLILKLKIIEQAIFPIFTGVLLLIIAIILVASKNIIYIGDLNLGTSLLYISSLLLPFGSLISIVIFIKSDKTFLKRLEFWTSLILLSFSILLITYDFIPFSTWN